MINNFPKIYDDELLYSVIARYHVLSGHVNYKKTLKQIFLVDSLIATMEFNGYIENLVKLLPKSFNMNSEYLIEKHTLFPIYDPFLPVERRNTILEKMKNHSGRDIKTQVGYISGSVIKKKGISYCPLCASHELLSYGEAYIHRLHQVEGVLVCPIHKCFLNIYNIQQNEVSRLKFITFDPSIIDLKIYPGNNGYLEELIRISNSFKFILENRLDFLNQDIIHIRYLKLLQERGLVVSGGRIRQRKLHEVFLNYYGKDFLDTINCSPEQDNEYNWIKILTRSSNRVVHPLRQILFINFLCGSVEEFFMNNNISNINSNNNKKKFPCLNPICDNYKKDVVSKYEIKIDNKTKNQIGTFRCECGFTYSRNISNDIYTIGKIIDYGTHWESNLEKLIKENEHSIREIARLMHCDPKTVVKYADKLNLKHMLNTNMKVNYVRVEAKIFIDQQKYKEDITVGVKENPDWSRTQIRKAFNKQYMWLYKNDKNWLEANLPSSKARGITRCKNMRVNWEERDKIILKLLDDEFKKLLELAEVPRITKSFMGRRINKSTLLEKHLDKLPRSKRYLDGIVESLVQFQKRRIVNILRENQIEEGKIVKWKIMRMAGLRGSLIHMVENIINEWESENRIPNRDDTCISKKEGL